MILRTPISRRTVTAGIGAALALGCAPAVLRAQSKTTLKLGHLGNEDNVWHKVLTIYLANREDHVLRLE